jgi:hypothetical protein
MSREYSLKDFFEEYKFRGTIQLPSGESKFALEVFKYDSDKGLFVASGEDDRGLSAIIGHINANNATLSEVSFTQIFDSRGSIQFNANIIKTQDNVLLQGSYKHPQDNHKYNLELQTSLRRRLIHCGWMNHAMKVVLPKNEQA